MDAKLRQARAEDAELNAQITALEEVANPFQFARSIEARRAPDRAEALEGLLAVRPGNTRDLGLCRR